MISEEQCQKPDDCVLKSEVRDLKSERLGLKPECVVNSEARCQNLDQRGGKSEVGLNLGVKGLSQEDYVTLLDT